MYKWRHLIENFFCKLKEFKRIAMRADQTDDSFTAIIHLAAAVINSRRISTDLSSRTCCALLPPAFRLALQNLRIAVSGGGLPTRARPAGPWRAPRRNREWSGRIGCAHRCTP